MSIAMLQAKCVKIQCNLAKLSEKKRRDFLWHTRSVHRVSKKLCSLFWSELRQISTVFNNFWRVDGKLSEILSGIFTSHLTCSVLPHYLVKRRSPKFAVKMTTLSALWEALRQPLSHDQAIRCSQQVGLLVTSFCPVFDLKFCFFWKRAEVWLFSSLWSKLSLLSKTPLQQ